MFAVLIHWMIKPGAEEQFLEFWRMGALIDDDSNLVGEFLCAPMPASSVTFRTDDLFPSQKLPYVSYVNIGFWRDYQAFYDQVGHLFNDDGPIKAFEQYRRRRIPLEPKFWRRGKFELPDASNV